MLLTIVIATQLTCAGLGFAQQTSDTPPESAIVEGTVINAQNSRSVPRAEVVLQKIRGPQASKSARADGNGRFIFKNVDPGTYRLSAERQGFFSDSHKMGFQPVFDVAPGAHVKELPVRLMPIAVVTGSVVDEYNDPVQNVGVMVLSIRFRLGQLSLTPAGTGFTNDRGEYRISGLRPGKYYVVAEHVPKDRFDTTIEGLDGKRYSMAVDAGGGLQITQAKDDAEAAPEPTFTYPSLFYPNTSDFLQAQQLPVSPGDEVHANFVFFTMPRVSIKGRVVNGLTGQPAAGAEVSAYWTEYLESAGVPAKVSPDGTFEVHGIAPGLYTLRASFTDDKENFTDQRTVEVGNEGVQNVQLAGLPDFSANGHVTVEGVKRAAVNHVTVEFIAEGVAPRVQASANGTHTVRGRRGETLSVIAGRHGTTVNDLRVLNNLPRGAGVRAGQLLKIDAAGKTVSLTTPPATAASNGSAHPASAAAV
jgi:LysM repeat protein